MTKAVVQLLPNLLVFLVLSSAWLTTTVQASSSLELKESPKTSSDFTITTSVHASHLPSTASRCVPELLTFRLRLSIPVSKQCLSLNRFPGCTQQDLNQLVTLLSTGPSQIRLMPMSLTLMDPTFAEVSHSRSLMPMVTPCLG